MCPERFGGIYFTLYQSSAAGTILPGASFSGTFCGMKLSRNKLFSQLFALLLGCCLGSVSAAQSPAQVRYAFAVNGLDFSLSTFRVGEQGELRHLGFRPLVKSVPFVTLDPSGQFVLVPSKTVSTIAVFRLNARTGALTPVPGSPFAAKATSPFSLTFHPSGRYVYAAARFSGVGAYSFDVKTGAISPLPGSPYPAGERTRGISIHPSGRYLYASNGYSNSVTAYRVNQKNGQLTRLPGSPFSVGDMGEIDYRAFGMEDVPAGAGGIPYDVTVDPQGRFVFVANWAAASISTFQINPETGGLTMVEGSPFFTGFNPYRLAVDPAGRFLYVTQFSSSEVAVHAIEGDTGKLSIIDGSPFSTGGLGPVAVNFSSDGEQLYVPNYESNDISLFDVNKASGALHLREVVKTRSGPWFVALSKPMPAPEKGGGSLLLAQGDGGMVRLRVSGKKVQPQEGVGHTVDVIEMARMPGGNFVYALDKTKGEIITFRLTSEKGLLTPVKDGVVATGRQPSDMTVDVNGWYLYVTNASDNNMIVYYLDPQTGIPRRAHKSPFILTGRNPLSVVLDSAARYAFVLNGDDDSVSVYSYMNSVTPLIFESRGAGSPFPLRKGAASLVVEPTGRFAYVANGADRTISAFRVHHQTGALAELPGSPFVVHGQPLEVIAHPNGRWLYVLHASGRDVDRYEIDPELGALEKRVLAVRLPVGARKMRLNQAGDIAFLLSGDGLRLLQYQVDPENGLFSLLSSTGFTKPVSDMRFIE